MFREIEKIISAPVIRMGAISLRQPIPAEGIQQISPFLLLHHFDLTMPPGENNFDVPPHPHRGFMPITFMYNGAVMHEDSLGNSAVIGGDEVQWINAARGLIHSEKAAPAFVKTGGRFQGIQLWINLPGEEKMKTPSYHPITKKEMVPDEKDGVQFRLVSGVYQGKKGPANSSVLTAMIRMSAGSHYTLSLPESHHVIIYLLEGAAQINEQHPWQQHELISFTRKPGEIDIRADSVCALLLGAADPIDEPLVLHGPFVMNTSTEILEAMRDYQNGKMGFLY